MVGFDIAILQILWVFLCTILNKTAKFSFHLSTYLPLTTYYLLLILIFAGLHIHIQTLIFMRKSVIALLAGFFAVFIVYGQAPASKNAEKANPNQPVLIERITKPDIKEDLTIPYSKYKFPNGLTLIVAEDHSDPIVHVDVTYHVGSAREDPGKSGFAHFFEHMMFQGSKDVANGQQFKIVTEAGGTMNGNTTTDRTRYFETMPKNYLETALWLEADRMGFLLDSVTQKKFEIQRATVKNEKAQRYDNRPYGRLGIELDKNFYPFGHPYSWPTIGYVPDLNRVGVDDLKKFFLRWYGPNNAVLTIGGDVNTSVQYLKGLKYRTQSLNISISSQTAI